MTSWRRVLGLVLLVVSIPLVAGAARTQAQPECAEPYLPIYAARTVASPLFGPVQLWPAEPVRAPISFVTVSDGPPVAWSLDDGSTVLTVTGDDAATFAIPPEVGPIPIDLDVLVEEQGSSRYLVLQHIEFVAGRPVTLVVVWDLDDPCRTLPPIEPTTTTTTTGASATTTSAPTTVAPSPGPAPGPGPTAPAARPISARPGYTG